MVFGDVAKRGPYVRKWNLAWPHPEICQGKDGKYWKPCYCILESLVDLVAAVVKPTQSFESAYWQLGPWRLLL